MSVVSTRLQDGILVVTVDYPPVNAIGAEVRKGLQVAIRSAGKDSAVEAVVVHCAGRTFMAGADIKEFGKPPVEPMLPDLVNEIEACAKPVIAAIHGMSLGGGCEIALGCHYRVALTSAKVGLPEVNLGLIPGAGGTQRLPRLVGAEAALDMITSGRPVAAGKAKELGILDEITDGDLLQAAIEYAGPVKGSDPAGRRLSSRPAPMAPDGVFDEWRATLAKKRRGFEAPQACVDAIEAACTLPFADGAARERELFLERRDSPQSAGQRHLFFAEREAARIPGLGKETPVRDIQSVAVIGAGTMGGGIAMAFANAGISVKLLEINADALAAGLSRISGTYETGVKRGRMTQDAAEATRARITGTTDYEDLGDADLVIEAVFERMDVKHDVFTRLDAVCKPGAILATNTSYLDVDEVAACTKRSEDVLGLHFFSPANIMKLLEIVRAEKTSPEVLATCVKLAKRIRKIGVVAGVCHGFIGNRIYQCYQREAGLMLVEGAAPAEIDAAMTGFGMPMGPMAVNDLAGLDIAYMMRKSLDESQYEARAFEVHNRLVEMDRKGQKTGAGFYRYEPGNRKPQDDPAVMEIVEAVAAEQGVTRRSIAAEEIVERCVLAMANEGARIVDEGIAYRPGDVDVVFVNGYGFPRYRGGPMHYAEHLGWRNVLERINAIAETQGTRWWTPAPKIEEWTAG